MIDVKVIPSEILVELHDLMYGEAAAAQQMQASILADTNQEISDFIAETLISRQRRAKCLGDCLMNSCSASCNIDL